MRRGDFVAYNVANSVLPKEINFVNEVNRGIFYTYKRPFDFVAMVNFCTYDGFVTVDP